MKTMIVVALILGICIAYSTENEYDEIDLDDEVEKAEEQDEENPIQDQLHNKKHKKKGWEKDHDKKEKGEDDELFFKKRYKKEAFRTSGPNAKSFFWCNRRRSKFHAYRRRSMCKNSCCRIGSAGVGCRLGSCVDIVAPTTAPAAVV